MTSKGVFFAFVLIILLMGCTPQQPSSTVQEPIKIGALIPLTGWGAYWGVGEQRGIDLAVKDIKAQGGDVKRRRDSPEGRSHRP